ncbi:NmrA family NAD(P)-binding protein [Kitasatospora sp. NPDC006697]|uniref:NmrA family NAD(P)-binding protein n=1 Tax=Kitasatospora sp. NPDC006697 TaxID=3364020 RepID=UPI0036891DA2
MSIVVTGATGRLGRLTVEALLRRGIPAADIIATGRDIAKIKDLADRGITVRRADFADADGLAEAFAGADRLLLISASVPLVERVAHHRRVIDAAASAGVSLVVYTSAAHADTATTVIGTTHRETEEYLRDRGIPSVVLRNGWYLENYTGQLPQILQNGAVAGAAGEGRISAAPIADYAEAAAAVLTAEGHTGAVYELGGDESFTLAELAAAISAAAGQPVAYADLPMAEFARVLAAAGVPAELAELLADADRGMSRGEMYTDSGDLRRLIGRPPVPLAEALAVALRH